MLHPVSMGVYIADELLLLHFQEEQFAPCARPRVQVGRILLGGRGPEEKKGRVTCLR